MKKKRKWLVSGTVVGGKFLGEVEAATAEEARELAETELDWDVSLCHQCADECADATIEEIHVSPVEDGGGSK